MVFKKKGGNISYEQKKIQSKRKCWRNQSIFSNILFLNIFFCRDSTIDICYEIFICNKNGERGFFCGTQKEKN